MVTAARLEGAQAAPDLVQPRWAQHQAARGSGTHADLCALSGGPQRPLTDGSCAAGCRTEDGAWAPQVSLLGALEAAAALPASCPRPSTLPWPQLLH